MKYFKTTGVALCMMLALTTQVNAQSDIQVIRLQLEDQLRKTLIAAIAQLQAQIAEILEQNRLSENISQGNDETVVLSNVDFTDEEGDEFVSEYDVVNGQLRERAGDTGNAADQDIWDLLTNVAGEAFVKNNVVEYVVFDDANNDTEAFVQASDEGNGDWRYSINRAVFQNDDADAHTETVIHEFSHILTLNDDQVDDSIDYEDCQTAYTDEGCPKANSYYQLFIDEFWEEDDLEGVADEEEGEDYAFELYEDNPENYVSDYAATNPGEDIAETFAFFVTEDKPDGDRDGIEKILWMYNNDGLVSWRNGIRERTGL